MPRWFALVCVALILGGCGEVTELELSVRPSQTDFEAEIQPLFVQLGCSQAGLCHTVSQGDFLFVEMPDADDVQANYLEVKKHINLGNPASSTLLAELLAANPDAEHNPRCFGDAQSCAYRKVLAWIAWEGEGSPRPQDIDCSPAGEACGRF